MLRSIALAAALLFSAAAFAAPVDLPEAAEARLDAGERVRVIVWFDIPRADFARPGPEARAEAAALLEAERARIIERALGVRSDVLDGAANDAADGPAMPRAFRYTPAAAMVLSRAEIEALAADPGVTRIVIDALDAPFLNTSVGQIGANVLHGSGHSGAGRSVAILDTGVDHQHVMFTGRITGSACFSSTDAGYGSRSFCPGGAATDTTSPQAGDNCEEDTVDPVDGADGCFHGTHVAGIAAGGDFPDPTLPLVTLRGVAPGAGIVAVQVFSWFPPDICSGSVPCPLSFTSDQTAALEWLLDNHAALDLAAINMSLGGGAATVACNSDIRAPIVEQLRAEGVATVIASGNEGLTTAVAFPGCIGAAVTVGSVSKLDTHSDFSNSSVLIDLLAPGELIRSASPTDNDLPPSRAAIASGTSMAAPHVAGAFALLGEIHPLASVDEIEAALAATGAPVINPLNNVTKPRIRVDLASEALLTGGAAGDLAVAPLTSFQSVGQRDQADSFATADYVLTNTGPASISWEVASDALWLTFEIAAAADAPAASVSGSLDAGASVTVTVGVDPAFMPADGVYYGVIEFSAGADVTTRAAYAATVAPPPPNDDFADAFTLSGLQPTTFFTNAGATKEPGEPAHADVGGGVSVWWNWTPGADVRVQIDTATADFDTVLAVYTGGAVNALTEIVSNDDVELGIQRTSIVEFDAEAGVTYRIAVDGWSAEAGSGDLAFTVLSAPANDDIADAQLLAEANGWVTGFNLNATKESGEPNHAGGAGGASVWYRWTAEEDGLVHFDAAGSAIEVLLAVYASADGGATIDLVGEDDDGFVEFQAAAGTEYYIALDGKDGQTGALRLAWRTGTAAQHRLRASVLPTARAVQTGQIATVFGTVINPGQYGVDGENCRIEAPVGFNGAFTFRTTDPETNAAIGTSDTAVAIPAGASQSFVLGFTPGESMDGAQLGPLFICDNIRSAAAVPAVSVVTLTAALVPPADIVAVNATASGDGILTVPVNGAAAFALAAINLGPPALATITPGDNGAGLPLTYEICQTNPASGACVTARAPSQTVLIDSNAIETFSVFVRGEGTPVAFAPASNRVIVIFEDAAGRTVGETGVAVRTAGP